MMMMIQRQHHPTVEIPQWDPPYDDPTVLFSPQTNEYFTSLHRYLPSSVNEFDSDSDLPFDSFSCDEFRMYEFKVRRCSRGRSHDWTECPYAHPGEKARRRDPRKFHYSGTACPEYRRGNCQKGDSCEFAHGVFECWLHPARYRTQPCKDGAHCTRRVCFFAHSPDQLRVLDSPPASRLGYESPESAFCNSPDELVGVMRGCKDGAHCTRRVCSFSPPSRLGSDSPESTHYDSPGELVGAMRGLQIGQVGPRVLQMGGTGSRFVSPRSPTTGYVGSGICGSLTGMPTRSGLGMFDMSDLTVKDEVLMERVESGKDLRAKIYGKLSKENSLDRDRVDSVSPTPDFGWVSELVK